MEIHFEDLKNYVNYEKENRTTLFELNTYEIYGDGKEVFP